MAYRKRGGFKKKGFKKKGFKKKGGYKKTRRIPRGGVKL